MELTKKEIAKISKNFKIPEQDIINFLTTEEKKERCIAARQSFLEAENEASQKAASKKWYAECHSFSDFEEFYVMVGSQISKNFFFDWLSAAKDYKEKRDVYLCARDEDQELAGQLLKIWNNQAISLEDVREAMSYLDKNSEDYKLGLKKIMNIYKS